MSRTPLHALAAAIALHAPLVPAQDFPVRPVRIVVPYLAGGAVDFVGRALAARLAETWGQTVVVDNRPGGGTNIGAELVAHAPPDGHTIFMGGGASAVNVSLYRRLGYDPVRDFAPVSLVTIAPNLLAVHPGLPVRSVPELITLAKAKPGTLTYASAGIASSNHLAGEMFRSMAGIDIIHVPYKGGGGAVTDLIAGHVSMYMGTMPSTVPHVRAGRLRGLAVTSGRRSQAAPDLPTIAEAALPGYDIAAWHALFVPARTPPATVRKLHADSTRVLSVAEVRERLAAQGAEVVGSTPDELARYLREEIARYSKLVRTAGIKAE